MSHNQIPNPIKHRRTWLGLSQEKLADLSGLTRQTVTDVEQGLYRKLPVSILKALSSSQTDEHRLRLDYASWVALRRRDNEYLFTEDYSVTSFKDFTHKVGGSDRGFCRALVIQRSLVQTYMASGNNWEIIENCLWHVSLSSEYTNWLKSLPRSVETKKAA